ncbi:MAG: hypothetical protein ACFFAQ_02915 [Promethearchaeota archaeon]
MKKLNLIKKGFTFLVLLSLFTVLFQNLDVISSNGSDHSLDINLNFEMIENSINQGFYDKEDSINITLPSSSWNIEDIELNFTNINDLGSEIEIIENKSYGVYEEIYFQNMNFRKQGLAVQIQLNESETLLGVYVYGKKEIHTTPKIIQVQVRGYDTLNDIPNNTLYLTMDINMSDVEGWYLQAFPSKLTLPKGDYFLVLNGSNIISVDDDRYHWYYNDNDPIYPDLLISQFLNTETWTTGISNSPFLYKLIRETEIPVYPKAINMTIEIDNEFYEIQNGSSIGSGSLPLTILDFSPNSEQINLPVFCNNSANLIFDVTYLLNTHNIFSAPASVTIKANSTNEWTVRPSITRYSNNCSVEFSYPSQWENFSVYKDLINIIDNVTINPLESLLIIPNNIITDGAEWEIKAYSPNINFNINTVSTEFEVGEELAFSIGTPVLPGNYTFRLIDPLGSMETEIKKTIPPDDYVFSYVIPSGILEGNYIAYLYWNNQTDAGVQTQVFTIISVPVSTGSADDFTIYLIIAIIIIAAAFIGFVGYTKLRKRETKGRKRLELILEQCTDVMNLKYVIVLDKKSGIDLYAESFEKKEFDLTLIAGYLQALHNFGTEVLEGTKDSRTIKLEYRGSILLMSEFVNLRIIIIMKENPSKNFLYSIESLAYDVYKNYGKLIDQFSGNLQPFRGIKDLVEKNLNTSFVYPLQIIMPKKADLNQNEKEMIKRALDFMKQHKFNYFYAIYLLPENVCTPKDYQAILSLIKKGIFQPVE